MLPYHVESWIWYGVVALVVVTRFISRIMILGSPKRLQVEDYSMAFVFALYTVLIVYLNIVLDVQTNLMTPDEIAHLTPQSIKDRRFGSKMVLLVEQCMCATIWGCKACLLMMYWRLTFGLKQNIAVKVIAIYVAVTFVVMEILYFAYWCRPFNQYWAVPVYNLQCSTATHHLAVNLAFNLSSDIMILCVPIPMLARLTLPLVKKIALCSLFSLGFFVMVCSILSKYYSFTSPFSPIWEWWYTREASTAVCVANIPHCWALWRRVFHLRSFINGRTANGSPGERTLDTPRRGTSETLNMASSRALSSPSQHAPTRRLSFDGPVDVEVAQGSGLQKEKMTGGSTSSSGDMPQSKLELELRRLEKDENSSPQRAVVMDRGQAHVVDNSSWLELDDFPDFKGAG